ncbi:MAG: Rossman fold protein, TIGR00730 family [Candidatus Taylorbacteria bacterium RIFCSPHIGHO2_01_FULL_46_22b]|uniref:Cytokinin riboside 5'-monophosphate phosphoribohydrolase n=1 Tax=Candidatus Taylorbacteria bacterium RIFCSPHIGHO2_01_FULL_46_22b TaxID=1802301 RepID=A0A1G2M4D7_9BACT|nr:MAG: Rossman fold protein, TIGR00730 family [Candidatus Taylorbacteria bacterium RIFCSPHIGHO2_01_FULL_46_22b]
MQKDSTHPLKASRPITAEEVASDAKKRVSLIDKEFTEGLEFIRKYEKSVSIFGSSMLPDNSPYCQKAREIGAAIAKIGYTVITGGGPGIMQAANQGAFEAGGKSIGLNITLPHEQAPNPYLTDYYEFYYFFSRKVALTFAAEAYLFFPGGYGTMNEFFEIATLVQTQRIESVPIILVCSEFWKPFDSFIKEMLYKKNKMIDDHSLSLYTLCDDEKEIISMIQRTPIIDTVPFPK